jgi:hypothetical protein
MGVTDERLLLLRYFLSWVEFKLQISLPKFSGANLSFVSSTGILSAAGSQEWCCTNISYSS